MATLTLTKLKRGTAPLLDITVDEAIDAAILYIKIESGDTMVEKSTRYDSDDITVEPIFGSSNTQIGTLISVQYTQQETLALAPGYAKIEVGYVFEDGFADKTDIGRLYISPTLKNEVMING